VILARSLCLLALAAPLAAQSAVKHPDLTGTWVLDGTKSTVDGPLPLPTSATYVVGTHGDSITVHVTEVDAAAGAVTLDRLVATDGYSWTNYMTYAGNQLTLNVVAKWNGAVLSLTTNTDVGGSPVLQTETWALSTDGKVLTQNVTTSIGGTYYAAQTLVFNKK